MSVEIHLALVTIPTITPILENLHHTLDPLKYVIIHVPMTNQPEKRNRIPDSCAMREKIHEWASIMPTQGELGYKDGFQCGENVVGCVGFVNVWFYDPRGQVHSFEA